MRLGRDSISVENNGYEFFIHILGFINYLKLTKESHRVSAEYIKIMPCSFRTLFQYLEEFNVKKVFLARETKMD